MCKPINYLYNVLILIGFLVVPIDHEIYWQPEVSAYSSYWGMLIGEGIIR